MPANIADGEEVIPIFRPIPVWFESEQEVDMNDIVTYFMLVGALGSGAGLPFWATSNQFGLMPESSGGMALAGISSTFDESRTFQWRWGSSIAANASGGIQAPSDATAKLMVDELYASFKLGNVPIVLDIGMKHQPVEFLAGTYLGGTRSALGSLSTTGGHLVWSGNARTLPGYSLTLEPWAVPLTGGKLRLYGSFADYKMIDHRYCRNELVHSTKAFVRFDFARHFSFHAGLDHYATWGGDRDLVAVNFRNYLRLIAGKSPGADGTINDSGNVIGDQGGAELFKLEYASSRFSLLVQHEIPYSDRSGMRFQNFPDGINTICFGWKDKDRWISDILFEYGYTLYQSGPLQFEYFDEKGNITSSPGTCTTGIDNYFNNNDYKDGWIYYGRMIGCPLFFPSEPDEDGYTLGIRNNRFRSCHVALAGKLFRMAPYKLMVTGSMNYGTYYLPYAGESAALKPWGSVKETGLRQVSAAFVGEVPLPLRFKGISATYGLFLDDGELLPLNYGCSIGLNIVFAQNASHSRPRNI